MSWGRLLTLPRHNLQELQSDIDAQRIGNISIWPAHAALSETPVRQSR